MTRWSPTASGAVANLLAQGLPFLLLIVVTPILLHVLGREQYGALVLFNLLPQIAGQLDLGLSTAATRGFAQYRAHADRAGATRLFRESLVLLVSWGVLLGAAFYLLRDAVADTLKLADVISPDAAAFVAAALSVPLAMANLASLVPLRALERYGQVAKVQAASGIAYWIVCTVWAAEGATLSQLVALGTANIALMTIALFAIDARVPVGPPSETVPATLVRPPSSGGLLLRPFLPVGAGGFVAQASSLATYNADKLLVSALVSPAAAGAYSICTSVANKTLLVIASAATFTFPRAARLHASGEAEALLDTYRTTARLAATASMAALVPLVGLAHPFLALWIDPAFADRYTDVFRLLAIGYALAATSVVAANVTMGIGKSRIAATFAVIGGLLTIASLALLAPHYGVVGAAAASLIGMSQTIVFNALVAHRLGSAAVATSWPLMARLAIVGAPLAAAIAWIVPVAHDWLAFAAIAIAASLAFPVTWCLTFGRDDEWPAIRRAIGRAAPGATR